MLKKTAAQDRRAAVFTFLRRNSARVAPVAVGIELVRVDLTAQRIAVDAQNFGGARLVAVRTVQNALDETLLEFPNGFVKQNSPLDHLIDEPFQLIFHDGTLR